MKEGSQGPSKCNLGTIFGALTKSLELKKLHFFRAPSCPAIKFDRQFFCNLGEPVASNPPEFECLVELIRMDQGNWKFANLES